MYINLLELRILRYALVSFRVLVSGRRMLIATDNTTTGFYINKERGNSSFSLYSEGSVIQHAISLEAIHIIRVANGTTDILSNTSIQKWSLKKDYLLPVDWSSPRWNFPLYLI